MGWWSPAGNDGITVGDEVFSATYRYLEEVRALYQEALGRPMTVDELATVLTIALQNHGGPETFHGVEELEVSAVTIKTKKRPSRPRLQVGDVFTIPLEPGVWGFGRIVNLAKSWNLVEVFAYVSREPRFTPAATSAERLFPPITVNMDEAFVDGDGRWRVIHSQPGFTCSDLDELEYAVGDAGNQTVRVNSFKWETVPFAHAAKLPPMERMRLQTWEDRIKDALRARGLLEPKTAE
jgi:hypothetical protein